MKVLHIDDNEDHVKFFSKILTSYGIEHEGTNSSREGLKLLKTKQYDLLFLDIAMPEMSGIKIVEKLNEYNLSDKISIVIVSAIEISLANMDRLLSLGVNKILRKPVEIDQILEIIEEIKNSQIRI